MTRIIGSDHPLTTRQRATLDSLLNLMVPASHDGRMPSAADVGFETWLADVSPELLPDLARGLDDVDAWSRDKLGTALPAQLAEDRLQDLRTGHAGFLDHLAREVMACYYQAPAVLSALGARPGPPFPAGNQVEPGDLSLLEPVIARGKIYRDI